MNSPFVLGRENRYSEVQRFRNSIIDKYIKQCVMDDIENIEMPVNATTDEIRRFYKQLVEKLCDGDCWFNINDYIEVEGIDISRMFGDERDINDLHHDYIYPSSQYSRRTLIDCKHELLRKYAFAYVKRVIDHYYLVDADNIHTERKLHLLGNATYFGFTLTEVGEKKYTITFKEDS